MYQLTNLIHLPCLHIGLSIYIKEGGKFECFLYFHFSEPDAPENFTVTVIDSASVRATWEDPLDSNGIILRFSLILELFPGQGYLPQPDTTNYPSLAPSQFELIIPGLHPFARYVFILSATTSVGEGNMTDTFEITNEAGNELLRAWYI